MSADTSVFNGWPGKPGVPLNPERRWPHVIIVDGDEWLSMWEPKDEAWDFGCSGTFMPADQFAAHCAAEGYTYAGPLHTPAEVAAREAAAAEAMREACAAIVDAHAAAAKRCSEEGDVIYRIRAEFLANSYAITQAADDVRVTPLPAPDALARARAEAEARGMLKALVAAQAVHDRAASCAREPDLIANIRREYLAQARGAEDVVDAIRAAALEVEP